MTSNELLLEIGQGAYDDLSASEIAALCEKYSAAYSSHAGLHAFQLLMKNFKATYRMGKTYEKLSEKYKSYKETYNWYASRIKAGKITATTAELDDVNTVDGEKFKADEN